MSMQENVRVDDEFIAAWNAGDTGRTLAVLSDDVVWRDIGNPRSMNGREAARPYVQSWYTAFPDLRATVTNRVVTDDQVAVEVDFSGTHTGPLQMSPEMPAVPPTGRRVNGKGTYFLRIADGKAVEVRTYPDVAGMMMQLGLLGPQG